MTRLWRSLLKATPIALVCSVLAAGPDAVAGARTWTLLRPALASPPRAAMTMEYDPVSRFVVTFGGFDDTQYLNQTWIWDGIEWAQPIVQTPPPPRAAAGMAYDQVTHQLVLFGGYNGSADLGDTWTWDGSARSWTPRPPAPHPPGGTGLMPLPDP